MSRERYLRVLAGFTAVVDACPAGSWDRRTPCPRSSARQLVGHVIDAQRQVVAPVSGRGPSAPVAGPAVLGALGRSPGPFVTDPS
ncbi:maleylpyruvate isomerase N-terminal domain-containing protein [Pseudonocardia sp. RS11V-5]|uniref:maleylpyruvate isomerase N-terminal domain-containing protein n=1 Tax=Pseudonocardia terrae TaxID=2905831 RepID=UPI001E647986|nr:maleylpyruvate isomerase N-terminal domain-containing protein [Pseudonocardia terrae]MCE3554179.1 maleylpyruvate isomerase N-terminal domain-containing protein [Pseudonocardia terrae]